MNVLKISISLFLLLIVALASFQSVAVAQGRPYSQSPYPYHYQYFYPLSGLLKNDINDQSSASKAQLVSLPKASDLLSAWRNR